MSSLNRVSCVHLLNDLSGSPRVLAGLVRELRSRGVTVDLFTNRQSRGFLSGLDANYHLFSYRRSPHRALTLLALIRSQVQVFRQLSRMGREAGPVVVNTLLPFGAALAGWVRRRPVIYYVHETSLRPQWLKRLLRAVAAATANLSLFVSETVLRLERLKGVPARCVPNFVADELMAAGRRSVYQPWRDGRFTVLMVASLRDYKGIPEFFAIAERVRGDRRIAFELVANASEEELAAYLGRVSAPENVRVFAAQPDVGRFYGRASLVVNLSRPNECIETFGLSLIEAMAFGVPVIGPPVGGPVELIEDGVEGYLIDSSRSVQVAERIMKLARAPAECLALSRACRLKAEAHTEARWGQAVAEALAEAV